MCWKSYRKKAFAMNSELKLVSSKALLIVSSTAKVLQKYMKQGVQLKNMPLIGVLKDMKAFMQNYGNTCHTLQTSREKKKLLSKQYIISALQELFQSAYIIHLFYSGHGHEDGDWAIQIQEQLEFGRITFQEMIQLWKKFRRDPSAVLNIYMDSCYSGSWVVKLQLLKDPSLNVNIYASCQEDQPSISVSNHGGLFFKCLFDRQENIGLNISKFTKYNQKPRFIEKIKGVGFGKVTEFDQDKIISLRKFIRSTLDNIKDGDIILSKHPGHEESFSTQASQNGLQSTIKIPHSFRNLPNPQQPPKQPGLYIKIICSICPHPSQFDIHISNKGTLDLCEYKTKCYCPKCKKKLSVTSIKKIYIYNIKVKVSGTYKTGQNKYIDRQQSYDATISGKKEYVLIGDVDELRDKWGWYEVIM